MVKYLGRQNSKKNKKGFQKIRSQSGQRSCQKISIYFIKKKFNKMSSFLTEGVLHEIFADQVISDKFKKREFVLLIEDGNYPQYIKFQLTQERCDLLDPYKEGEKIRVSFNLRGKPFQNRQGETVYFTNLEAWKIEAVGAQKPATATQRQAATPPPPQPTQQRQAATLPAADDDDGDDLPF